MFRDAIFKIGCCEFILPIRENEIRRIERDYGVTFVKWVS